MLQYYYTTRINRRLRNEDALGFRKIPVGCCPDDLWALIAADGMGGGAEGEAYSNAVVTETLNAVGEMISDIDGQPRGRRQLPSEEVARMLLQRLPRAIGEINRRVISSLRDTGIAGGGSTVAGALFIGPALVTFNVGDSPVYLLSDGTARELSVRDNESEELVRQGRITRDSDEYARCSGALTAFIGDSRTPDPHAALTLLSDGDTVIAGSDGAFGNMTDARDVAAELRSVSPSGYADRLCAAAASATFDNQSVIVAVYTEEPFTPIDSIRNIFASAKKKISKQGGHHG